MFKGRRSCHPNIKSPPMLPLPSGAHVEWVDSAFPYTLTAHPQHIGVGLVYTSMLLVFGWNCWPLVLAWHGLYGFQTIIEGWTAQDEHEKIKAEAKKKDAP